jgi:hypothetical protein
MTKEQYERVLDFKGAIMDAVSGLEKLSDEKGLTAKERGAINRAINMCDSSSNILEEIAS